MTLQQRNYPKNSWWVAAAVDEIGREPLQRWLLETPVVLFRNEDGTPVALEDRCPHRWAPLSSGYLEGDTIVCPYHGARFGANGACTAFPSFQAVIPKGFRVRSFPVIERGPFIWVWLGDEAASRSSDLPPDFAWRAEPQWTIVSGSYSYAANYMLLHENVLDLTHFNYLHAKSFQFQNWKPAPAFEAVGNRVRALTTISAEDFNDFEREAVGLSAPGAARMVSDNWFETPAWHSSTTTVVTESGEVLSTYMINHLVTPAAPGLTHYWWFGGIDRLNGPEAAEAFNTLTHRAFLEDKGMLESIQLLIDGDPRGLAYPEFSFKADGSGILARRALQRILDGEKGQDGDLEPMSNSQPALQQVAI